MEHDIPGDPAREDPEEDAEDAFRDMTFLASEPDMRLDYDPEVMHKLVRFRQMGVPTDQLWADL